MNLVDADILYDKFVKLEDQALGEVNKYMHDEGMVDSFKRWSTILNERSAYKYDIMNMPRVDAEPVRHGKWIHYKDEHTCTNCGQTVTGDWNAENYYDYCPHCGARMDE